MDWSLLIGLPVGLALVGAGTYGLYRLVSRTKEQFAAQQPALRITNLSALNAGDVLTLTPELENLGSGTAYDCVVQLGGWEGNFSVMAIHPRGPRHRKHAIPIVLGPDAPIRSTPQSNGYLRLACRDCWGLLHECWYPVAQTKNPSTARYDILIELSHPNLTEPNLSFWSMRKLLRNNPAQD